MRALPVYEARISNQLTTKLLSRITSAKSVAATTYCKFSTYRCLFIVIIWNVMQAIANFLLFPGHIATNANDHVNGDQNHDVNSHATSMRHPQSYIQLYLYKRTSPSEDDANAEVSTAREKQRKQQLQQQRLRQHLSSFSPEKSIHITTIPRRATMVRVIMLLIAESRFHLMTLLMVLLLSMHNVSAGTCWQPQLGSGKCNQIFSTNITKDDCCKSSQSQIFSYTDRELSNVEYFFATAIGGGVECIPCIESCKGFKCGPNKKCVKRKGRPKCVCAPECGATLRRKQLNPNSIAKTQQWAKSGLVPPRGSRSLSSEMSQSNLMLNKVKRLRKLNDDNQRKQKRQEMPMKMPMRADLDQRQETQGETKSKRLLIVDSTNLQEQPATRQLQMENRGGRVRMRTNVQVPTKGSDRRTHKKNNSSNNNSKHLTRSLATLTAAPTAVTVADRATATSAAKVAITIATGVNSSSTTPAQLSPSRLKSANANEPANINKRSQQQQELQNSKAIARVRHQHQQHSPNREKQQYSNERQRRKHRQKDTPNHKDKHRAATSPVSEASMLFVRNTTMSDSDGRHHLSMYDDVDEHGSGMTASSGANNVNRAYDVTFLAGIHTAIPVQQQAQQQPHTNPVCGNDGRTYNTECQLRKRACRTNNAQLEVSYRGHCKTSCKNVLCLNGLTCVEDQYMMPHCISCNIECPWDNGSGEFEANDEGRMKSVCGVDGITYRSSCDINRMICKIGRAIAVAYPGPCRGDHITCADIKCGPKSVCLIELQTHKPRCVSCHYKCSRKQNRMLSEEKKICGYNNRTYNSWCEMRKDSCATGYYIGVKSIDTC